MQNAIVVVRWLDSRGASGSWEWAADLTDGPCRCVSVGLLVAEHPDHVVIAPHFSEDEDDDQFCGVMYIPRSAIIQMDALLMPAPKSPGPEVRYRTETSYGKPYKPGLRERAPDA